MIGASITDIVKTAVTAPLKIAANPTVRQVTLTALKNNQYTQGYAQYADVADKAVYRDRGQVQAPRQAGMPMPYPMPEPDEVSALSPGVQDNNILLFAGLGAAALVVLLMLRK